MASVRYIANDVDKSVDFYRERLGFEVEKHNPGKFAEMTLDDLHLFLNAPGAGSAGKAGGNRQPGGWNRFMVVADDLDRMIGALRQAGASFRGDVAEGGAGRQILLQDPSGNVIELFEYAKPTSAAAKHQSPDA
jgi:catechol 2,3-dioxygenase-like lactoylglutathione lyase family enzyme